VGIYGTGLTAYRFKTYLREKGDNMAKTREEIFCRVDGGIPEICFGCKYLDPETWECLAVNKFISDRDIIEAVWDKEEDTCRYRKSRKDSKSSP